MMCRMRRFVSALVVLGAIAFSCYAPHYDDCHIACTPGGADSCPEGFHCAGVACLSDHSSLSTCSAVVQPDAPEDNDGSGSGSGPCGWPFVPSNFDPCDTAHLPPVGSAGTYTYMGQTYEVDHVQDYTIASGATQPVGVKLLVIAEQTVTIDGTLDASKQAMVGGSTCNAGAPLSSGSLGGGGAGGGFGTGGGSGGPAMTGTNGATAGTAIAAMNLIPLLEGCPGTTGASAGSGGTGGSGGAGGGAIEISCKGTITVNGSILADGGGGTGGYGGMGAGGGGGGASGGGILLEASQITINGTARVCAVGGGGGQGGTAMMTRGTDGTDGVMCVPGTGGSLLGVGGPGGDAAKSTGAGKPGGAGGNSGIGGAGGGGGGNGRIVLHSGSISTSGQVVPPPNQIP